MAEIIKNKFNLSDKLLIAMLFFIILSVLDTKPLLKLAIKHEENKRTVNVGKDIPDNFPVVIITPVKGSQDSDVAIVFYGNLKEYLKTHKGSRFTAPLRKVKELNKQLEAYNYDSGFGVGSFTVKQLPNKKQYFKVSGTWDDDRENIGWYQADAKSILPDKYAWYFGPGLVLMYMPVIFVLNLVFSILIAIIWLKRKNRRS